MNYKTNEVYGDLLETLPTNTDSPNSHDIELCNQLFPEKSSNIFFNDVKKILILSLVFLVLSVDNTNNLLNKLLPNVLINNSNKVVLVKLTIFIITMIVVFKVI
jgi:hypothetical protein